MSVARQTVFECACRVVVFLSLLSTNPAVARDLTIVSWGGTFQDGQRDVFFRPFAAESKQNVLEQTWKGGYGILETKALGGNPDWDVVQVEADNLAVGCDEGIFEKLDWSKIGPRADFLPNAVSDCGVGTVVFAMNLLYDGDKLRDGPKSWADFWDFAKFPGKRALRRSPKGALEFALMADGVAASDVYKVLRTPKGVDRAFDKLGELKGHIIWWETGAQPLQLLQQGEVVMTSGYNARVVALNKAEKRNFRVVWPGSMYAVDSWVILKGSTNKPAATEFIAFASRSDNQQKMSRFIADAPTNKKAAALLPPDIAADLPTAGNIRFALAADTDFWADNVEALTRRFDDWVSR